MPRPHRGRSNRSNGRPPDGAGRTCRRRRTGTLRAPTLPARPVERVAHGGLSSIGRASDCGSEGYGFKPRRPPHQSERESGPRCDPGATSFERCTPSVPPEPSPTGGRSPRRFRRLVADHSRDLGPSSGAVRGLEYQHVLAATACRAASLGHGAGESAARVLGIDRDRESVRTGCAGADEYSPAAPHHRLTLELAGLEPAPRQPGAPFVKRRLRDGRPSREPGAAGVGSRVGVGLGVDVSVGAGSGSSSPLDGIAAGVAVAGPSAGISTFSVGRGTTGGDGVRSDDRVADWATGGGADGRPASRSPASTDRATRPASIKPPPTRGAPRARLGRPLGDDPATPTRTRTTDGASECRYSTSSVGDGCRVSQSARTTS